MRSLPQPPRRTRSEGLVALFAALAGSSVGAREWEWHEEITPEKELRWAQRNYAEGTNFTVRGMFREAEERIGGGIGTASGKLQELESRARVVEPLQGFIARFRSICDRFENDWTNAVLEAFALERPIKDFVATNPVVKGELDRPLRTFDWLRKELSSGNRRDAGINLRNFQDALRRPIGTYEDLRRLEPSFRAILDDLERAREDLKAERVKPFDAERALGIARAYVDVALGKTKAPGGEFLGADWDLDCARAYLNDVREMEPLKEEAVAEVEASIVEAKRLRDLAGVRHSLQAARTCMEKNRPDNAIQNIRSAEEIYLPRGKGDPAFEELANEVADLRRAAERKTADMERARDLAAIERCRGELGDPNATVLPETVLVPDAGTEEELRRFAAEADFAAILRRELSENEFDLYVSRGRGSMVGFSGDPGFLPTLRAALARAVNTNYPSAFPGGERFSVFLCIPFKPGTYDSFCPRTRTDADGRKVVEVVPRIRRLDVIRTSAQPDDAYLYFDGDAGVLFEPGGRTALFPGLGALLAGKLPKSRADRKTAPITFRNEAKPDLRSAPPVPRVLPDEFVLPEIPQEWRE